MSTVAPSRRRAISPSHHPTVLPSCRGAVVPSHRRAYVAPPSERRRTPPSFWFRRSRDRPGAVSSRLPVGLSYALSYALFYRGVLSLSYSRCLIRPSRTTGVAAPHLSSLPGAPNSAEASIDPAMFHLHRESMALTDGVR